MNFFFSSVYTELVIIMNGHKKNAFCPTPLSTPKFPKNDKNQTKKDEDKEKKKDKQERERERERD